MHSALISACMALLVATSTATPDVHSEPTVSHTDATIGGHNGSIIHGQKGKVVRIPCTIKTKEDLLNTTVAWIRTRDYHVLTVGRLTYIADERFQIRYEEDLNSWTLTLHYAQERDSGTYKCQLSSDPMRSFTYTLLITNPTSIIVGGPEMYVKEGSEVQLICEMRGHDEEPEYVFWYHQNVILNYEINREVSVSRPDNGSSTLFMKSVELSDSGNYTCTPSNAEPSIITLWVIREIENRNVNSDDSITADTPAVIASNSSNGEPYDQHYEDKSGYYSMGLHTLKIPMSLHQENRERLIAGLQARGGYAPGSVVILQGAENAHRPGSGDINYLFRQESYFHWAFGVLEPGWYGSIAVSTGRTTLFMPRLPQEYAMWMGRIRTPEEFRRQYQVDEVRYVDEMAQDLKDITSGELLTLHGINSDSGRITLEANFDGISNFTVNNGVLHDEIAECRVHKTESEIKVMRYAASVSCAAHREVMRKICPGMKEYQLESIFQHHTYYHGGCRHHAYGNICGSGPSAAILHYGHAGAPNDRTIRDDDAIMLDMGAEYYGYASDVSVSYPANGKFSDDHKIIYNSVLAANHAVAAALKPGVSWVEMQSVAYRAMLEKLKESGLVQGEIDEMMEANIGSIFQPHGLGHLLGIDVHDVGGYLEGHPSRPEDAGYSRLRTARIIEENMVLTIEPPGCYFIDHILDEAFANQKQAQFLVHGEIERFRGFGGVRIEDDVLVTTNGMENLSHELPRTVEDIESLITAGREDEDDCNSPKRV